jgi:membrane-bound lytic murein transglycosylase A
LALAPPSRRVALALCAGAFLPANALSLAAEANRRRPSELPGFATDDLVAALATFRGTARALLDGTAPLRAAKPPSAPLLDTCRASLTWPEGQDAAHVFFDTHFNAVTLAEPAFFTGYYEPELPGALTRSAAFTTPLLGRPADLETFAQGETPLGPGLSAGRRDQTGRLVPYPTRADIEAGALGTAAQPLVWLRDPIEAFMVHVQGSVRVRLEDGRVLRLAYAGRNGQPYTSIGRILVTEAGLAPEAVDLAGLKAWVRAHGQGPDTAGGRLMARNASYIFFSIDESLPPDAGPRGGAGVSLTPLRSLAIDRQVWSYGLPFWVEADLPEAAGPLARLMIAQDTGAAIVGPARFDLFFGSGPAAGAAAGGVRHGGRAHLLLPIGADFP